ncbi:MAG: tetratricopeptide repeat protein [Gammaproteobacteria bacterium]|nr:tetratricopeptide repeat protein [Gammaproteobacteria bacterium]
MNLALTFREAQALHQQGRLQQAFALYEQLLKAAPRHAEAWHYSGILLHQAGQHAAARARIEQALRLAPGAGEAWLNYAQVLQALGLMAEADAALGEALAREPARHEPWNALAALRLRQGQAEAAEKAAWQALKRRPGHTGSLFNLALALRAQGKLTQAAKLLAGQEAATLRALHADLLRQQGQANQALVALERIAPAERDANLWFLRGQCQEACGQGAEALTSLEQALALDPAHGPALSELLFLKKRQGDWRELDAWQASFRKALRDGLPDLTPFSFLSDPGTRAEQRRAGALWSRRYLGVAPLPQRPLSEGRLRIGYLSADLHQHATALLIAGMIEGHDRQAFEIFAYSTGPDDESPLRRRMEAAFEHFVEARGWRAEALARRIAEDGIDILVDLKGHTENAPSAVLAYRPAPIQVNYLGYPGSMGEGLVDYLLGDAIVTPAEHAADYSETLVLLPGSYQINDRERQISPETPSRADLGLPENGVVFCCFNNSYKFNPAVFDAWAEIVSAVPGSVLWLLARAGDEVLRANWRREFSARGLDAERLIFADFRANADYLALYRRADLFLDTWPYNAHTTASDALWAGCPVSSFLGETFAGRVAASLLHAVGLPELVAPDRDGYVRLAISLARSPERLRDLRRRLAEAREHAPLFDTARTTRAIEQAYRSMAAQHREGLRRLIKLAD